MERVTETVSKCSGIDSHYIFTSEASYLKGAAHPFRLLQRDPSLDADRTLGIEIYRSFAKMIDADIYVLVHATSPFLSESSLQAGIDAVKHGEFDSAFSARRIQTFCWYQNKPLNYLIDSIPQTQNVTPVFWETSGFYVFRKHLLEANRRIGDRPKVIEVSLTESLDIDNPEDLDDARMLCDSVNSRR